MRDKERERGEREVAVGRQGGMRAIITSVPAQQRVLTTFVVVDRVRVVSFSSSKPPPPLPTYFSFHTKRIMDLFRCNQHFIVEAGAHAHAPATTSHLAFADVYHLARCACQSTAYSH